MGVKTEISWCDSTVNPMSGCDGCELWIPAKGVKRCYAGLMTERMLRSGPMKGWPMNFSVPTVFPGRIEEACKWNDLTGVVRPNKPWIPADMPRLVFVGDMGDIFSNGLPDGWLEPLIEQMEAASHIWMLLTKRPSKMREFFDRVKCPNNIWLGTSITKQQDRRVEELCAVKCDTIFLSVEPQHEEIRLPQCLLDREDRAMVMMGGESGEKPMPYLVEWPRQLMAQCDAWKVRPFVKQLGGCPVGKICATPCEFAGQYACSCNRLGGFPISLKDSHGGNWDEWPPELTDLKRREFPSSNILIQPKLM